MGEIRNISPISFELRPPKYIISTLLLTIQKKLEKYFAFRWKILPVESGLKKVSVNKHKRFVVGKFPSLKSSIAL